MTLRILRVPAPAVGQDWSFTVPGQWIMDIVSINATLATRHDPTTQPDLSGGANTLAYNPNMYLHETFGVVGPFGAGGGSAVDCRDYDSLSGNWLGSTPNGAGTLDVATFTFEALVNCQNTGNVTQTVLAIDDAGAPTHFRCGLAIDRGGGNIRATASAFDQPTVAGGPGTNVWGLIAATWDGAQWVGYLNGVASAPVAGHAPTLTVVNKPLFALGDGISSQGLNARAAAGAYYSGALTAARLLAHANAIATSPAAFQAAVLTDGPLAFWMFDGTVLGGSRNATLKVSDGTNVLANFPGGAISGPGLDFTWTWTARGGASTQSVDAETNVVAIPELALPPGYVLSSSTLDLAPTDQWSNITLWFDDGTGPGGTGPGGTSGVDYLDARFVPDMPNG